MRNSRRNSYCRSLLHFFYTFGQAGWPRPLMSGSLIKCHLKNFRHLHMYILTTINYNLSVQYVCVAKEIGKSQKIIYFSLEVHWDGWRWGGGEGAVIRSEETWGGGGDAYPNHSGYGSYGSRGLTLPRPNTINSADRYGRHTRN